MSQKSFKPNKFIRRPAILTRKRKAESDIELSPPSQIDVIEIDSSPLSNQFPSSCEDTPSPSASDSETDEATSPAKEMSPSTFSGFRGMACMISSLTKDKCKRKSPLPELNWGDQTEVWHSLVLKDVIYPRDHQVLEKHPEIDTRMWAILIDWLSEVSEVYGLHRETFYLAQDYIHGYLIAKPNLPKNCLQLLGATALFVAAKMEEIYPPKLDQFAYVTDGACTEDEILAQELLLIMTLNWSLSPFTIINWLNVFMQLAYVENSENFIQAGTFPKKMFVQICQVLDLCILDITSFRFSYSLLVASVIAHFISKETAMHVSGLSWDELLPCVTYLKPVIETVLEDGGTDLKSFSDIPQNNWHNIQAHTVGLKLYDKAQQKHKQALEESSPSASIRQLTPPLSSKKVKV